MFKALVAFWNSLFVQPEKSSYKQKGQQARTKTVTVKNDVVCGKRNCGKEFSSLRGLKIHQGRQHKAKAKA